MLVGKRVGLTIHGCNFPGHFMARANDGQRDWIFDCFNGGRALRSEMRKRAFSVSPLW